MLSMFFSGYPLEYHYFMEIFKEVVEKKIEDPRGRVSRLIKYITGETKYLIKHYIQKMFLSYGKLDIVIH